MPQRRNSGTRSPAEWATRALLATAVAMAGGMGVAHALARTLAATDAELAHRLAPGNGRITALRAGSLAGAEASMADRRQADRLAREALREDPTAVLAASTLGLDAQVRGDTTAARRVFAYAERLSRRDLNTQLWAIEDAVGRSDVSGALRHYDIALRTAPKSADLLFPVLASAIADPSVRAALVRTLAAKPNWTDDFVRHVAAKGSDPRVSAQTFMALRRAGVAVPQDAESAAVNALLSNGHAAEAWNYYASFRNGAERRMSRDPRFAAGVEAPSLLDWTTVNDAGSMASIQRGGGGGAFAFSAPAGVGGPLLQQVQMLPPGEYRLVGHSSGIDQVEGTRPYWVLGCRGDGREFGRVVLPNSAEAGGSFGGRLAVPAGCSVQTLVLVAQPSSGVSGLVGQIDRVQLLPAR